MKKRNKIIKVIIIFFVLITVLEIKGMFEKWVENNTYYINSGFTHVALKDYKILKTLTVEGTNDKGEEVKNTIILTSNEYNDIMNTAKLTSPNENGTKFLKENDFVYYLKIMSQDNEMLEIKNNITNEYKQYVSRQYANNFFSKAHKVFELNVPEEYIAYYVECKTPYEIKPESNTKIEDAIEYLRLEYSYNVYGTNEIYLECIDIIPNVDNSITIQYYGCNEDEFGSFTHYRNKLNKDTNEKIQYVLSYNKNEDKWNLEQVK